MKLPKVKRTGFRSRTKWELRGPFHFLLSHSKLLTMWEEPPVFETRIALRGVTFEEYAEAFTDWLSEKYPNSLIIQATSQLPKGN